MTQPVWNLLKLTNRCLRNARKGLITDVNDETNARFAKDVVDVIREEYQELCGRQDWHWLRARDYINVKAQVTGTAFATNGSTNITTVSSLPSWFDGAKIKFDGYEETYVIQTGSTTSTTILDRTYNGTTTGATAEGYTIYLNTYDVASDFGRFLEINKFTSSGAIEIIGVTEFRERQYANRPYGHGSGASAPRFATLIDNNTIELWPWPVNAESFPYEYIKEPSELSTNTSAFDIPNDDITVLIHRVMMILFGYLEDDTKVSTAARLFNDKYAEMSGSKTNVDDNLTLQAVNSDRARFNRARRGRSKGGIDFGDSFDY